MRVINRTAVTITGAQPFIDWMRDTDADFNRGAITVPRAKAYGSAFLLPEFDLEEDLQEWVEENVAWLFDFQLSAWTEQEETWPENRDLKTFREWFRIDIHSVVVDVAPIFVTNEITVGSSLMSFGSRQDGTPGAISDWKLAGGPCAML